MRQRTPQTAESKYVSQMGITVTPVHVGHVASSFVHELQKDQQQLTLAVTQ